MGELGTEGRILIGVLVLAVVILFRWCLELERRIKSIEDRSWPRF